MLMKRQLFLAGISLILGGMPMLAQDIPPVNSVSYEWKSVPIVGGGFVDGIVFHPEAPGVRYCRTDMGGSGTASKYPYPGPPRPHPVSSL